VTGGKIGAKTAGCAALLFMAAPSIPLWAGPPSTAQFQGRAPAAALRVDPGTKPLLDQAPQGGTLLVVGGALIGFGVVGRKRRARKVEG